MMASSWLRDVRILLVLALAAPLLTGCPRKLDSNLVAAVRDRWPPEDYEVAAVRKMRERVEQGAAMAIIMTDDYELLKKAAGPYLIDHKNKKIIMSSRLAESYIKAIPAFADYTFRDPNDPKRKRAEKVHDKFGLQLIQLLLLLRGGYELEVYDLDLTDEEFQEFARLDQKLLNPEERKRYEQLLRKWERKKFILRVLWVLGIKPPRPVVYEVAILPSTWKELSPMGLDESLELVGYELRLERGDELTPEERARYLILKRKALREKERRARLREQLERIRKAYAEYHELLGKPRLTPAERHRLAELEAYLSGPEVPERYRLPRRRARPGRLVPVPYGREPDNGHEGFGETIL